MTVKADAAKSPNAALEPFDYELGSLGPREVDIAVDHCGICHRDLSVLEFAARHGVKPTTEHFPMSKVNDAFDHLRSGKARYRIVIDREGS